MSSKTIFDPALLALIRARLMGWPQVATAKWGTMTAPQTLAHLDSTVSYALSGEKGTSGSGLMARWPMNKLVIHVFPWPEGRAESPPEFLGGEATNWEQDKEALIQGLERFVARGPHADWPASPAMGRINGRDWGVLMWRHLDHHLRQFDR